MPDVENAAIVLVVTKLDLFSNLRDALADINVALLHAQTEDDAIALLERLKSKIDLAIIELELPDFGGWDLIRQLTRHAQKPANIIAATSTYTEPFFSKIKELGFDAVVPTAMSPEVWRKTVEAVLEKNENTLLTKGGIGNPPFIGSRWDRVMGTSSNPLLGSPLPSALRVKLSDATVKATVGICQVLISWAHVFRRSFEKPGVKNL